MELLAVGLNYNSAPLAIRERLAFPAETLTESLQQLQTQLSAQQTNNCLEAAILSTCNRTEVYCAASDLSNIRPQLLNWIAQNRNVHPQEIDPHLYILPHQEMIRHTFRVASGLDSMVLGEAQILGQMKQAARTAEEAGTLGHMLHQLFQRTFSVAKEVRTQTDIGHHSVSMASAGVKLAQRIFGDLSKRKVLFVGAGEMIQLCATYFSAQHPQKMTIANRNINNARNLASQYINAKAIGLAELPQELPHSDIVISCTASTLPIIGLGMVQNASKKRKREPIFMLDLAVPRDIEAEVKHLDDVFLYTVDDLSQIVQQGRENRAAAVEQAEAIIDKQVQGFLLWAGQRSLVPIIRSIHQKGDEIAQIELEHSLRLLTKGDAPEEVLQLMAHRMSAKFLHGPMQALRQAPEHEREVLLKWLPQLFNIKNTGHK